jgi:hypothetical protein
LPIDAFSSSSQLTPVYSFGEIYELLTGRTAPARQSERTAITLSSAQQRAYRQRVSELLGASRKALRRPIPRGNVVGLALAKHATRLHRRLASANRLLANGYLASAVTSASTAYGRSATVAEIAQWLANHPGRPAAQLWGLMDWFFSPGHYGDVVGAVVYSRRGIAEGNLSLCKLLQSFRYRASAVRVLDQLQADMSHDQDRSPNSPAEDNRASLHALADELLAHLIRGFGKIRSVRALDPLIVTSRMDKLVTTPTVKKIAASLVRHAETRFRYAKLVQHRLSPSARATQALQPPAEIRRDAARLISPRNVAARHALALSSAWLSINQSSQLLYQAHAQLAPATARSGAEHASRIARMWATAARSLLGYVPPEVSHHYVLAEESRARGAPARAEALFDLATLDSLLTVMLVTGQVRL